MRTMPCGVLAVMLTVALSQPALSQHLRGKFVNPTLIPEKEVLTTADLDALHALQNIKTPLTDKEGTYEYGEAIRIAKLAVERAAAKFPNTATVDLLQTALETHVLALQFWKDCQAARMDFYCDENRPSVAEVLRRYPKPRGVERISSISVVEALRRIPKFWINTRVRITRREVVEYIPAPEQKVVLRTLWEKAAADTKYAANALGQPQ